MRIGIIELHVSLRRASSSSLAGAIKSAIRRDALRRRETVLEAVHEATKHQCDVIVFPGWTLAGDGPPHWLVAESNDTAIVFECLVSEERRTSKHNVPAGTFRSSTFIAQHGRIVWGPIHQVGATAMQIRESARLARLAAEVRATRDARLAGRDALLLVCGEANVVSGFGDGCYLDPSSGLRVAELQRPLIINPAHTPGGPQAVRDKRAWLSRRGILVTTANTHSGGAWRSASKGAKAWVRGRRADDRLVPRARTDGMALRTLDVR